MGSGRGERGVGRLGNMDEQSRVTLVCERVSVCVAGPRACCFTPKWVALLFVCVIKYSALTLDGVSRQRYRKEKKQRERHSKRSPVSTDLIRYHNLTKQSLLIHANAPRQFLQIPPTLPNATMKLYLNPQTRGDSVIVLIMLFLVSFPPSWKSVEERVSERTSEC